MKSIMEINNFIKENKDNVNPLYRLKYHMMPPIGWMNDPNGLVYLENKFHVCYQYNPYNSLPGTMLWGHFTSEDLIKYNDEVVAIAPTLEHSSIFSGGAMVVDDEIHAVYTLHYEHDGVKREEVYLTSAKDSVNFIEGKCVFDNNTLPSNLARDDFRDPFPVKINEWYYVFLGARDITLDKGVIVLLRGKTLSKLEYFSTIGPFYELGVMGECPSYYHIDGKDVILASGCAVLEVDNNYKNVNSSVFLVGNMNFETGEFILDFVKEIDKGDAFYAPQFISGYSEAIMIGWMEMWGKPYPTHELGHGWSGALSIPRKISIKNNDIYQEPIETLASYHQECREGSLSKTLDITLEFENGMEFVLKGDNGEVSIKLEGYLSLNTLKANNLNGCIRTTNNKYEKCLVRVLLDVSSIEVFVDNGREVISSRIYIDGDYQIITSNGLNIVDVKEIGDMKNE